MCGSSVWVNRPCCDSGVGDDVGAESSLFLRSFVGGKTEVLGLVQGTTLEREDRKGFNPAPNPIHASHGRGTVVVAVGPRGPRSDPGREWVATRCPRKR